MSDERTVEGTTAAAPGSGAATAAPQVPYVSNGSGASRPPAGTILAQGGDVPSADEGMRHIDYGDAASALSEGQVVRGIIVHIDREGVLVDVGTKSEGLIPPHELSRDAMRRQDGGIKVGDDIDVYVLNTDDDEAGQLILSKKRADFEKAWDRVIDAQRAGEILNAVVTERVKGGLVVDLGIRGFVPASHVGTGKVRNLEKYVGMELPLKVIEVDRERRKVVLSHRLATEEERQAQREETLQTLAEGQVRPGVVRRITDYGAFVDIGGVDGLLHISEMSWTRIKHPNDVLKVGDEIQVMVLKTNLEQGRISLGLRQILPDPWTEAQEKYTAGSIVAGNVTRLVPFGAFVQVEGGLEGIVPNNELSSRRVSKPEEVVQVGDQVEVKILEVRPEERRMTLSLRQAREERGDFEDYKPDPDSGRVTLGDVYGEMLSGDGDDNEE
ncbi:MAG TPA: 30S ribosomal protein S1 [Armatimonadota bacterium]|nr:30S ribosomal protein S1 [Armatimonadota bacterium]